MILHFRIFHLQRAAGFDVDIIVIKCVFGVKNAIIVYDEFAAALHNNLAIVQRAVFEG